MYVVDTRMVCMAGLFQDKNYTTSAVFITVAFIIIMIMYNLNILFSDMTTCHLPSR